MIKLEQFREIADDNLRDLSADERMVMKVRQLCNDSPVRVKARVPRFALCAAAACVVVMGISAAFLMKENAFPRSRVLSEAAPMTLTAAQPTQARTLSSKLSTSESVSGDSLSYGIASVEEFSEGFAVALATTDLYGYVNEDNLWVVLPMYESAAPVKDGRAQVVLQGKTMTIEVP